MPATVALESSAIVPIEQEDRVKLCRLYTVFRFLLRIVIEPVRTVVINLWYLESA